jgi:hypothetical protein
MAKGIAPLHPIFADLVKNSTLQLNKFQKDEMKGKMCQ